MNVRWIVGASLVAGFVAMALSAAACDGDDEEPAATATRTGTATATAPRTATTAATPASQATAIATGTASPAPTEAPPGESTGVPAVDAVIAAVLSGDTDEVVPLVQLRSLACGPQQGAGSPPPCPQGQPNGTTVSVLPVATCEGEWRPESAVAASFEPLVGGEPELYAVYGMPTQFQSLIPDGRYVAVFSYDAPGNPQPLGAGVVIGTEDILGIWYGCAVPADQIVPAGTSVILPPTT
jgi:hypothetical protein